MSEDWGNGFFDELNKDREAKVRSGQQVNNGGNMKIHFTLEEMKNIIEKNRADERERCIGGYKEIIELYAGMEGFVPETAPEGYQKRIIEQMYEAAINAIKAEGG